MQEKGTIHFQNVSKSFKRGHSTGAAYTTLKSLFFASSSKPAQQKEFVALDNVSLRVEPGSSLGVIGRNGSGKSSLLKLIAGIYQPDSGTVKVTGRVSALIELGAGFHPEFTGRENVYLGGAMFGLSKKEVDSVFKEIVHFAELEDFVDEPVRTYSSGMFMRLGFSLAVHTQPDVLLVDEVLSVGDAPFVSKCREKILELRKRGVTLLLVSHDLHSIQTWCDEVLWLHKAKKKLVGSPEFVIDSYLAEVQKSEEAHLEEERAKAEQEVEETEQEPENPADSSEPSRWGSRQIEITSVELIGPDGVPSWVLSSDKQAEIVIKFKNNSNLEKACFGVGIYRADGLHVLGTNTEIDEISTSLKGLEEGECRMKLPRLSLAESSYYLDVAVHDDKGVPYDYHHLLYKFTVKSHRPHVGVYSPELEWRLSGS